MSPPNGLAVHLRWPPNTQCRSCLPWAFAGNTSEREVILDILVEAVGRQNFGCDTGGWDFKGLQSPKVQLNGG